MVICLGLALTNLIQLVILIPEDYVSSVLEPSLSLPEISNCRPMVIVTSYHGYLLKDCFHSDVNLIRIR